MNKIRKGDTVKILSGKDKGKVGKVLKVLVAKSKVVVEGVNVAIKHKKARYQGDVKGRVKIPMPIHVSKVMLIDPATGKPCRVGFIRKDGKVMRISKKTGKVIDSSMSAGDNNKDDKDSSKKKGGRKPKKASLNQGKKANKKSSK